MRAIGYRLQLHARACLYALLLFGASLPAIVHAGTDTRNDAALAYLSRWQAESGAPGVSAAVMVGDQLVFSAGVGTADLQTGMPQDARAVHGIGSVSKTQAVVAVMQLVEQRKVRLDDEIQVYAPWFPRKQKPITVRQLLTHTSGIRHYRDGEFGPNDVMSFRHYDAFEESTRYWRDEPLLFDPGTHWAYSTYGTSLMQAIVETASGLGFEQYLTDRIWRPAGMADTRLDISSRVVPRRGQGYQRGKRGALENVPNEDVSYKYAGGGMISTDEDLCRFGRALNAGLLLKRESLAEMYRLQLPADIPYMQAEQEAYAKLPPARRPRPRGLRQGLIFNIEQDGFGRPYVGHTGGVKGVTSRFIDFTQHGVIVALHFNIADTGSDIDVVRAAEALAALYLPDPKSAR
jgi:CubicO group peptidase (beta-lactamase class C family)